MISRSVPSSASAARARAAVMSVEQRLGFDPTDRELEKLGYDIESRIPGTDFMAFMIQKNPVPMSAVFLIPPGTEAMINTRIKMGATSTVYGIVRANGNFYVGSTMIKVRAGGGGSIVNIASVAGVAGGAYAGHQIEKNAKSSTRYDVIVKMEDGSTRTFSYESQPAFQAGSKVRIVNGALTSG